MLSAPAIVAETLARLLALCYRLYTTATAVEIPFIWFAIKAGVFMATFILLRASLPRPRYDQMMAAAWKVCLPLALINLLVTAAIVLWRTPGA